MSLFLTSLFLITTATILWFLSPPVMFGYIAGLVLGVYFSLSFLRKLGKNARRSEISKAFFNKLTRYQASIYRIDVSKKPDEFIATTHNDDDFANILDVLKRQMRVQPNRAMEAARFAMDVAASFPLQEKIRVALQWLDSPQNAIENLPDKG